MQSDLHQKGFSITQLPASTWKCGEEVVHRKDAEGIPGQVMFEPEDSEERIPMSGGRVRAHVY